MTDHRACSSPTPHPPAAPRRSRRAGLVLAAVLAAAAGNGAFAQQASCTYDEAGRLIQVTYANGAGLRYVYDDAGNLLQTETTGAPCTVTCSADVPAIAGRGSLVTFAGSATPSACIGQPTYLWSFGDGSADGTGQNPVHTFAATGSYAWSVTVTVADQTCTSGGTITIVTSGGPARRRLRPGPSSGSAIGTPLSPGEAAHFRLPPATSAALRAGSFGLDLANEGDASVTVRIDLLDDTGTAVAGGTCALAPREHLEITDLGRTLGAPTLASGHATVTTLTAGGQVLAHAVLTDRGSSDPIVIQPEPSIP